MEELLELEDIKKQPKIELHAHLNASLTQESFKVLMAMKGFSEDLGFLECSNMDEAFSKTFSMLTKCVTHAKDHEYICNAVFQGFYEDNVRYLEIRSTPKALQDLDVKGYIDKIIEAIELFEDKITVRYLLSLNRSIEPSFYEPLILEMETNEKWQKYVVGLDYSGNPSIRHINDYIKIVEKGRELGMKMAFHIAEIDGEEEEIQACLALKPERLGHYYKASPEDIKQAVAIGAHIEVCPSSNMVTTDYLSLKDHIIVNFIEAGAKLSICTDDLLIFKSNLSEEIKLICDAFGLGIDFCRKQGLDAIDSSFLKEVEIREKIRKEIELHFS